VSGVELHGGDETAYSTADLRVARDFKMQYGKGKVEFILQNAFGEYFDFYEEFISEKRALISVSVDFD